MAKSEKSDTTKKIKLSLINTNGFISFLKKFSSQEPGILIELRGTESLVIKTATPKTSSVIKYGTISFDELFMTKNKIPDNIFIGLYNIGNFISTFSLLEEEKTDIILFYDENKKGENICKKMTIETASLKYHFANAPKESFQYVTDEVIQKIFNPDTTHFTFKLDRTLLNRIQKLIGNEAAKSFSITTETEDSIIYFKGKQFELKVDSEQDVTENTTINIGRQYLNVVDREIYSAIVVDKGLLLKSDESNTFIAIAREKPMSETQEHADMEIA